MCGATPNRYCVLGLSSMIHEYHRLIVTEQRRVSSPSTWSLRQLPQTSLPEPLRRPAQFIHSLFNDQCQPTPTLMRSTTESMPSDYVLLGLKAWGNAGGVLEWLEPGFGDRRAIPCLTHFTGPHSASASMLPIASRNVISAPISGHFPLNVTWSAVFAVRRLPTTPLVKHTLLNILLSESVPVEGRIAACLQLTPTLRGTDNVDRVILQRIVQLLRTGQRDWQVLSFVESHWFNILESSQPAEKMYVTGFHR